MECQLDVVVVPTWCCTGRAEAAERLIWVSSIVIICPRRLICTARGTKFSTIGTWYCEGTEWGVDSDDDFFPQRDSALFLLPDGGGEDDGD